MDLNQNRKMDNSMAKPTTWLDAKSDASLD